jgi:hypothetical protein
VSNAEKQPTGHGPEGCDENGPAAALLVGHVSIQICSAPRALPSAHFDRNESHVIYGTGHKLADMKSNEQVTIARGQEIDGRSETVIVSQSDLGA